MPQNPVVQVRRCAKRQAGERPGAWRRQTKILKLAAALATVWQLFAFKRAQRTRPAWFGRRGPKNAKQAHHRFCAR